MFAPASLMSAHQTALGRLQLQTNDLTGPSLQAGFCGALRKKEFIKHGSLRRYYI
jgi:hypothetical protein